MRPVYWIIIWSFFSSGIVSAQLAENNLLSIVRLYNGSVYIGEIKSDLGQEIEMILADGNRIKVKKFQVKEYLSSEDVRVFDDGKYQISKGTFFQLGLGFNLGNSTSEDDERVSTLLNFNYLYHLNQKWVLGAGIGFEFMEAEVAGFQFDTQFVPLYAYGRYYLLDGKRRLYLYSRLGYGFPAEESEVRNDHEGGGQFQTGIGLLFPSKGKTRFNISLGYHYQQTNGQESFIDNFGNEVATVFDIQIQRVILAFSMDFGGKKRKFR
jgi:hypothetical protein